MIEVIVSPEQLISDAASLQLFLTYCNETEDDIDYRIKLISFAERAEKIRELFIQQYGIRKDKQKTVESL